MKRLRGEIVYKLYEKFQLDPYLVIIIITAIAFFSVIYFFSRGFIKKKYPIIILPFVVFLGNPVLNNSWMRADSMIILIFAAIIFTITTKSRFYLLWINLLGILGSLIHEIFIFITIPILFVFVFRIFQNKSKLYIKSILYSTLALLPIFISSLLVTYFKGTSTTSFLIWNSWKGVPFPETVLMEMEKENMGAIAGIGLSIKGGLSIPAKFAKCFEHGLYGPLVLFLTILSIYLILNNINKLDSTILGKKPNAINTRVLSSILLFQFCVISPLFIIGDDFSRWIYIWVSSSFALLIIVPEDKINQLLPMSFQNVAIKINKQIISITGNSKILILMLLIIMGLPLYSWNLNETVETSSLYIVLSSVSSFFERLMHLF